MQDPVGVLEELSSMDGGLEEQKELLRTAVQETAKSTVDEFDFISSGLTLSNWFLSLIRHEPPREGLLALDFGLFESEEGCTLYVTGSNSYDPENSDWACSNDWWPEGRYAPLPELNDLWKRVACTEEEPWQLVQGVVIILLRDLFNRHGIKVQERLGSVYVATGFDDGDLYSLRRPTGA